MFTRTSIGLHCSSISFPKCRRAIRPHFVHFVVSSGVAAHATPLSDSANVTHSHVRALPGILRKIGSRMRRDNRRRTSDRLKTTARRITSNYFSPAGITVLYAPRRISRRCVAAADAIAHRSRLSSVVFEGIRASRRVDRDAPAFFYECCELLNRSR